MRYEPPSITVEPALGKQPARLLALTLCERSGDLGIPVRQICGTVLEHQVEPDRGYVIAHPIDDRCSAAFEKSRMLHLSRMIASLGSSRAVGL